MLKLIYTILKDILLIQQRNFVIYCPADYTLLIHTYEQDYILRKGKALFIESTRSIIIKDIIFHAKKNKYKSTIVFEKNEWKVIRESLIHNKNHRIAREIDNISEQNQMPCIIIYETEKGKKYCRSKGLSLLRMLYIFLMNEEIFYT
jgi:hypothetical protein